MSEAGRRTGDEPFGEILALPASGDFMMFQRVNTHFPKRKQVRVESAGLVEFPSERFKVGMRTVVLGTVLLRRSPTDSTPIGHLQPGDSVEVLEGMDSGPDFRVLVRHARGQGWLLLPTRQCPAALLRGICFSGD